MKFWEQMAYLLPLCSGSLAQSSLLLKANIGQSSPQCLYFIAQIIILTLDQAKLMVKLRVIHGFTRQHNKLKVCKVTTASSNRTQNNTGLNLRITNAQQNTIWPLATHGYMWSHQGHISFNIHAILFMVLTLDYRVRALYCCKISRAFLKALSGSH